MWLDLEIDTTVVGVDESGRGSLAGPLVIGFCIVNKGDIGRVDGVRDSKKLSSTKRAIIRDGINRAHKRCINYTSNVDIDERGINNCFKDSLQKAVPLYDFQPDWKLLVDGNIIVPGYESIVRGDTDYYSIAAASIVAKTSRDWLMIELAKSYPQYGFEKHKGYGTKKHIEAIKKYGPSPVHRMTFLRRIL